MTITIQATSVQLDLPADLKLNIEITNPIFSDEASSSLPISLPLTATNRRALNFPDRVDIYDSQEEATRTLPDIAVIVSHDSWQKEGYLIISSCTEKTAEATIYFAESIFKSRLDSMTVAQAMAGLHYGDIPPSYDDIGAYRDMLFQNLNEDCRTYPTILDTREDDEHAQNTITYAEWRDMHQQKAAWLKTREFIIAPVYTEDGWLNSMISGLTMELKPTDDAKYITAFLRLDFILHRIFESIGYSLEIDFSTMPDTSPSSMIEEQWHSIVVLNNTMDALYPGCMYYSALVPEITCKEFLRIVESQFGCVFYFSEVAVIMKFHEGLLLRKPVAPMITGIQGKQISFGYSPERTPREPLEKIDEFDFGRIDMPSLNHIGVWHSSRYGIDRYPQITVPILKGLCQRTTTTIIDGEDASFDDPCPLVFACMDMAVVYHTEYDDHTGSPIDMIGYYPTLRRGYIEKIDDRYVMADGDGDIGRDISRMDFRSASNGSLFQFTNKTFETITDESDEITISAILSKKEWMVFDWERPYVIQGRLAFPSKMRYVLDGKDQQEVQIDFISPRRIV